jgi:hypothetical protein
VRRLQYRIILTGLLLFIATFVPYRIYALPNTLDMGTGSSPALVLNRSRLPITVYSNGLLWLAACTDLACPSASVQSIAGTNSSAFPSIILSSDEKPVISYYNTSTNDLMLVVCNDSSCSTPTVTIIDSVGDVGQYSSIELNRNGAPVISYYDVTHGNLKLAICNNITCSSPIFQVVESARDVGQFTSLSINNSDSPVISYYNLTNQWLHLAVCSNDLCTNRSISIIDRSSNVGQYTSLALNSRGWPVISYYDARNRDLKLAICTDASCTRPTLRTIDSTGTVGLYTSLALNPSDIPTISYFVSSQNISRLMVCRDSSCNVRTSVNLGSASAAGTAVELRDAQGVYVAFTNSLGNIVMYADIPTPIGCYIDAPSTVDEGTSFRVSVRCDGLTAQVYGFEIALHTVGNLTPRAAAFIPGTFVLDAGSNILQGPNQLTGYAVSRRIPATALTGSFSLGNVDFNVGLVQTDTTSTIILDRLLLGDIQGGVIAVPIITTAQIRVENLP